MNLRAVIALAAMLACIAFGGVRAEDIVLTVRTNEPSQDVHILDLASLEALPQQIFSTSTVWTESVQQFSGPTLKSVLESLDLTGTTVHARALNDYVVEIPVASLEDGAPIIATRIDGAHFSRRDKGPLWIVYPYDSDARFQTESTYGRSIWQLQELRLE